MSSGLPKKIYGLIGYPVQHSLSPRMHNAAFRHLKINAEYRLFEVEPKNLANFLNIDNLKEKNIWGLNVTIPFKVKVKEILENIVLETEYYVKLSGAVNTIKREGDILSYHNTDASGFLRSLENDLKFQTKDKKVLLIGCGGAGRAVIAALSWKNVGIKKIYVNDISEEAINSARQYFSEFTHLSDRLEFIPKDNIPTIIKDCDLLINASPLGMKGEDISVIDKNSLRKNLYVYDIVYNREKETRLIRDAKACGLKFADGLSMLLYQGVDAFELWTGQKAPVEIMRKALMEVINR